MDVSASPHYMSGKMPKEIKISPVLVVEQRWLKLYTLSGKEKQSKVQSE